MKYYPFSCVICMVKRKYACLARASASVGFCRKSFPEGCKSLFVTTVSIGENSRSACLLFTQWGRGPHP